MGKPLTTIKDYEIVPDAGSGRNPYATDSDEPIGTYTIHGTSFSFHHPVCIQTFIHSSIHPFSNPRREAGAAQRAGPVP